MLKWRRTEQGESGTAQRTRLARDAELRSDKLPEMCGEGTDSGREATDSASLTSSQQSHTSSGACSSCTDTSGAPQSEGSLQGALKIPNTRRSGSPRSHVGDTQTDYAERPQGHSRVWGSVEHLESDESIRHAQPIRKTSSMDDLLDTPERPIRGILRRRLSARHRFTPSHPRFVLSRYNPQFRTLPVPRRGQQPACWPPADLPVQKSFLSLQKFRRRPARRENERRDARRPSAADIAVLRYDLTEESRSLGYLSATELGDVRYFSRLEVKEAQYLSGTEVEDRRKLSRPEPPEHRAARQQRQHAAALRDDIRQSASSAAWRPSAVAPASPSLRPASASEAQEAELLESREAELLEAREAELLEAREAELLEALVTELVNMPPTLKRWYQAVSAAGRLGLILPLYRGLSDRLDPVTLAKLLFKVSGDWCCARGHVVWCRVLFFVVVVKVGCVIIEGKGMHDG